MQCNLVVLYTYFFHGMGSLVWFMKSVRESQGRVTLYRICCSVQIFSCCFGVPIGKKTAAKCLPNRWTFRLLIFPPSYLPPTNSSVSSMAAEAENPSLDVNIGNISLSSVGMPLLVLRETPAARRLGSLFHEYT